MKPNYKNWIPKGMIWSFATATAVCLALFLFIGIGWLKITLLAFAIILALVTIWTVLVYRTFSYDGKRQMSRQIIEGVANLVNLPEGGKGLDVGCGSGALTIAVAKRNPKAQMIGIDRWGKEYASYNKLLCYENAKAEGVDDRIFFAKGDALNLDFPDETFDAVTSNYVYHNIFSRDRQEILLETLRVLRKGGTFAIHDIFSRRMYGNMQSFVKRLENMGYEQVELINTDSGLFMSCWEARWMTLRGSAILFGKK